MLVEIQIQYILNLELADLNRKKLNSFTVYTYFSENWEFYLMSVLIQFYCLLECPVIIFVDVTKPDLTYNPTR